MPTVFRLSGKLLDSLLFAGIGLMGVAAIATPDSLLAIIPPCPIKFFTGHECWGCGISRAIIKAVHGEFSNAIQLNPFVLFVLPLLVFIYAHLGWRILNQSK